MIKKDYCLPKQERLSSKKKIENIFIGKKVIHLFPFSIYYSKSQQEQSFQPASIAFSVSKKFFKKAVDRNRIKRMMKEVYRNSKHKLFPILDKHTIDMMWVYQTKEQINYAAVELNWNLILDALIKKEY